jgi:hypothetical protein
MMSSKVDGSKLRRRGLAEALKVSRNSKKRERLNLIIPPVAEVGRGSQLRGRSPHLLNHHHQRSKSRVMGTNLILRWINGGRGIEAMMIWTSRSGFNKN